MRITQNTTKIAIVTASTVVTLLLGFLAAFSVPAGGAVVTPILASLAIIFMARTFRGRDEPVAPPRPWWRTTAKPTSGFVVGALLCSSAFRPVASTWTGDGSPAFTLAALLYALLALWFLGSAIRLTRQPQNANRS